MHWVSFGNFDRADSVGHYQLEGVHSPFGPTQLDVKNLYAMAYEIEMQKREGLANAGSTSTVAQTAPGSRCSSFFSQLHSTLAIFLETTYQAKWQPVAGFIEGV